MSVPSPLYTHTLCVIQNSIKVKDKCDNYNNHNNYLIIYILKYLRYEALPHYMYDTIVTCFLFLYFIPKINQFMRYDTLQQFIKDINNIKFKFLLDHLG